MNERARKLVENEAVFRAYNEGVLLVEAMVSDSAEGEFVCECSDPDCAARIRMPFAEYVQLRANSSRFVIKLGHEVAALEHVVQSAGA